MNSLHKQENLQSPLQTNRIFQIFLLVKILHLKIDTVRPTTSKNQE